jgi:hypothetical protein
VERVELFQFKNFEIPDFPAGEYMKQLQVQSRSFIIVTKSNRIFRWRPDIDRGCVEMELPDSGSVGVGQKLVSIGSALIQAAKKPFYDKDKKESVVLERIFMDP